MSSKNLKIIADKILKDLQKTANKAEDDLRKDLEKQPGQIFIVNQRRFFAVVSKLFPVFKGSGGANLREKLWDAYTDSLMALDEKVKKLLDEKRIKELKDQLSQVKLNKTDFVVFVPNYAAASYSKSKTLSKIIKNLLEEENKSYNPANLDLLGGKDNTQGSQIGHAEIGAGVATSSARVAKAESILDSSNISQDEKEEIRQLITIYKNKIKVTFDHEQIIDGGTGKFLKEYVPILSFQSAISNQRLAKYEQIVLNSFQAQLKDIGNLESSTSLKNGIAQTILYATTPKKAPNIKVKGRSKKKIAETSKAKTSGTVAAKRKTKVKRDNSVGKAVTSTMSRSKKGYSSPASAPLQLIGLFNKELPRVLEKNMQSPRLNYQTGRFANSVNVVDFTTTRQGFLSFGYVYQKAPYQTFEPGYRQGSPERDPRKLIDYSMREIASAYALGRFYTRRL